MLTDKEIEQAVTKAGGGWDGDHWKFEDADLHPFVRGLLAAERERWTLMLKDALRQEGFGCACVPNYRCGPCRLRDAVGPNVI